MTINRRKFTQMALIGGATFAASSGVFFPKPSEAFFFAFLLRSLSARAVFGGLLRYAAGSIIRGLAGPSPEEMLKIQLADRDFIERQFTRDQTQLARSETNIFWGRESVHRWGPNVGFGFVQTEQNVVSNAIVTGPTMTGIHVASEKLFQMGLSPNEIARSLLPTRSQYVDWCDWDGQSNQSTCFGNYRTVLGEVTSRYDLVQPGRGGYGNVQLIIEAGGQPRRDINVQVKFV